MSEEDTDEVAVEAIVNAVAAAKTAAVEECGEGDVHKEQVHCDVRYDERLKLPTLDFRSPVTREQIESKAVKRG